MQHRGFMRDYIQRRDKDIAPANDGKADETLVWFGTGATTDPSQLMEEPNGVDPRLMGTHGVSWIGVCPGIRVCPPGPHQATQLWFLRSPKPPPHPLPHTHTRTHSGLRLGPLHGFQPCLSCCLSPSTPRRRLFG